MILRKILVLISIVRGESDQKDTFETVKVNSGINIGKGSTQLPDSDVRSDIWSVVDPW